MFKIPKLVSVKIFSIIVITLLSSSLLFGYLFNKEQDLTKSLNETINAQVIIINNKTTEIQNLVTSLKGEREKNKKLILQNNENISAIKQATEEKIRKANIEVKKQEEVSLRWKKLYDYTTNKTVSLNSPEEVLLQIQSENDEYFSQRIAIKGNK